jgi:serine protease Do
VSPDETVSYLIANTTVGSRIPIELIRNGRRMTVTATVGQRPTDEDLARQLGANGGDTLPPENAPVTPGTQTLGLSMQPITPQIAQALNLPATSRGLVLTSVDANSDAYEKGLRRGDLIISINREPVTTQAQFVAQVEAARRAGRTSVLLLVKRGTGAEIFVGIDITAR